MIPSLPSKFTNIILDTLLPISNTTFLRCLLAFQKPPFIYKLAGMQSIHSLKEISLINVINCVNYAINKTDSVINAI
jgi:hypothetical protein